MDWSVSTGRRSASPNDPAVIANPENRSQIFNWKLTETQDPFGNIIRYDYERELGDTADHLWDQLYLRRIRYVDYADPGTGDEKFLISVTFNYEERPDPFSEYRPGFEIRTTRRCTTHRDPHPRRSRTPGPHVST